jgi:hypothetical protein
VNPGQLEVMASPWSERAPANASAHTCATGAQAIVGNAYCNGLVGPGDVLTALVYGLERPSRQRLPGRTDTDCDRVVTANDVLRLLRFLTGDTLPQSAGCAQIGSPFSG